MICPSCAETIDPIGGDIAPPLAICPACESSIVLANPPSTATAEDMSDLTQAQLDGLRLLRTKTIANRKAYYAAHH